MDIPKTNKAVFLDRDGTLNVYRDFIFSLEQFELLPFAAEAIKLLNNSGYLALCVTNQPSPARGECTIADIESIHEKMKQQLERDGALLNDIKFCPHYPSKVDGDEFSELKFDCLCRKPKTKMIDDFVEHYNIDLASSWFVGDTERDIQTARNAGIKSILVKSGKTLDDGASFATKPDFIFDNLLEAARFIINE